MSLFLCADCGGSNTTVVICSSNGTELSRSRGGQGNFATLGLTGLVASIQSSIEGALEPLSISPKSLPITQGSQSPFIAARFGISGVDSPSNIALISPALSALLGIPEGPRLAIGNDISLLSSTLALHTDVQTAVGVICGTGSIAVSFSRDKDTGVITELTRSGGWGFLLGDEGSGVYVGREALRQVLGHADRQAVLGLPQSSYLGDQIVKFYGAESLFELLSIIYDINPAPGVGPPERVLPREKRLSSLAPLVFTAGLEKSDPIALRVLQTTSRALAESISVLLATPDATAGPNRLSADSSLITFGGSLVGVEAYRKMVLDALVALGHKFKHVEFVGDAALAGAKGLVAQFGHQA